MILDRVAPTKVDQRILVAEAIARQSATELLILWGSALQSFGVSSPQPLRNGYHLANEIVEAFAEFSQKQLLLERLRLLALAVLTTCKSGTFAREAERKGILSLEEYETIVEELDSIVAAAAEIMRLSTKRTRYSKARVLR